MDTMSDTLKDLLWQIRQHPGKNEFLDLFKRTVPVYKKGQSLEEYGAECAVASGETKFYQSLEGLIRSK